MKYLISILALSAILHTHAQSYSIEWSELQRSNGRLLYLLPIENGEFYALRWSGGRLFGSYQASHHVGLKQNARGKIKIHAEQSIANFEGARLVGNRFMAFLSDKREGYNHFFMQEYTDSITPKSDPIKLASYALEKKHGKGWFDVKQSSNGQFFAVVWEVPGKRGERDKYGFKIFDTTMQLINDGEYPLPFDPKLSTIHEHHISNTGDYFLAVTEYDKDKPKGVFRNGLNYKALHIYHIAEDGLQDFELDIQGKRVEAMAMSSDDSGVFTITGIYGEMDVPGVSGVFHQRLDVSNGAVLDEGFKEFDEEFVTQGWDERDHKRAERRKDRGKGDPQLYNYRMREATMLKDGSIVGTMEQYYVQIRTYTDGRTGSTNNTYYYYYNDIIAYRINPEGEFDWVEKIKKYQVSTNDGGPYSSYESFVDNGKMYFVFNDNVRNYSEDGQFLDQDKLYTANYSRKRNVVALAEIDLVTGEKFRRTFFDRDEIDALAVPKMFDVNYKTGEMLIYAIWGRKEKVGILRFKE